MSQGRITFYLIKMNDVCADVIEERLVVRNDEQRLLPVLQIVVQPDDGVQVQVIRRFVEHQKCRLDEQGPSQGDAHAPTTGKFVCRSVLHLLAETQTSQQTPGLWLSLEQRKK